MRSDIEIERSLSEICGSEAPLTAMLASGEQLFLSQLLAVDRRAGTILIACSSTARHANSVLLGEKVALFAANLRGTHYEFEAGNPQEAEHAGAAAIRLDFPHALIAVQRRTHARIAVPASVALRCELTMGPLSFDARVVDISVQGVGSIVYDPAIHIDPGMRFEQARIVHPDRPPVVVDLLVRHVRRQAMPDGSYVLRAGCSFIGNPSDIEDLIRLFVAEL